MIARLGHFADQFGGLICLSIGFFAAVVVGDLLLVASPTTGPTGLAVAGTIRCRIGSEPAELALFAVEAHWAAIYLLEATAAIGASSVALFILGDAVRTRMSKDLVACLLGGFLLLCLDAHLVWEHRKLGTGDGFLAELLATLPLQCGDVGTLVARARLLGELPGFALGVAMSSCLSFGKRPGIADLARSQRALQRLAYAASMLFVAGVLMSRANFTLVLGQWTISDQSAMAALSNVVSSGVLQAGVGYTALLLVFLAPARLILSLQIGRAAARFNVVGAAERRRWLEENELRETWKDELRTVLALLGPIVSAPVFEALNKVLV